MQGATTQEAPRHLGFVLGILVMAQFAVVIDFSIVQIALPTIRVQLSMSLPNLQWIVSAYGLTFAGLLLLGGRLSDTYGRKTLFASGLIVFALSSLAAGLANSDLTLIGARAVQGVGAAFASATGLALITRIFSPLGKLSQALGVFTAVAAAGFSIGVILGGILTEALGWRWIFFVNVPLGAAVALLALRFVPDPRTDESERQGLDLPGAILVTGGLMLLVYGLSQVGTPADPLTDYVAFLLAALVLGLFALVELRARAPLMPLGFIRRRTIFFANALTLLAFATTTPMVFLLTAYFQVQLAYPPLTAAAALIPGAIVWLVLGGFGAPRLVTRFGAKPVLITAMCALSAGMLLLARVAVDSSYLGFILPAQVLACVGGGLSATASNVAALSGTERREAGLASGLINTSRQVGGPVGLAVVVSILGAVTKGQGFVAGAISIAAFQLAFLGSAGFSGLALAAALLLSGKPKKLA